MESRHRMVAILFFLFACRSVVVASCGLDDVAVYKVNLRMLWSEETFPKDYPSNPTPHWSQVFGQSHNRSYALYRIGEVSRPLVRDFAQFGTLTQLAEEGDEEAKVYDQFIAPAVGAVGDTDNVVFVDGEHSLVSLVSRMIPSPDWFIGVDSVDLCVDSSWIEQVTLDLDPLDGGAVNGLTFNHEIPWPSDPVQPVTRIASWVSHYPNSSFYYRRLRQLPPVAKVEFIKLKEYSTKELNNLARKELISKFIPKSQGQKFDQTRVYDEESYFSKEDTTMSEMDKLKDLEEDPVGTPRPGVPENNVVVRRKHQPSSEEYSSKLQNMDDVMLAVANGRKLGLGRHLPRHFKSRLHHAVNRRRRV